MNITGKWHDPDHPGSGLDIERHSDGVVVATWYGYGPDGRQAWMIARGVEGPTRTVLQAWITWADPGPENHHERECGTITLAPGRRSDNIGVRFDPESSVNLFGFDRLMCAVYTPVAEQPAPAPAPTPPAPEPEPPTPAPSGTRIIVRNDAGFDTGGRAVGAGVMKLPSQITVEVLQGSLTITNVSAWGDWNPRITGVRKGQVLPAGSIAVITVDVDAAHRKQVGGNHGESSWQVDTAECGNIVQLTAHVEKP